MLDEEFKAQPPDFNINDHINGPYLFTYKFYCPLCKEKVVFHVNNSTTEDTFPCPTCQGVMLLEDELPKDTQGDKPKAS
jgi:hypothetical protein